MFSLLVTPSSPYFLKMSVVNIIAVIVQEDTKIAIKPQKFASLF